MKRSDKVASGCIVGDCPVCGDLIWEDEFDIVVNTTIHDRCKKQYIKSTYHMSEEQFQRFVGVNELRKNIEEAKKTEEERHRWSLDLISKLEKELLDLLVEQDRNYQVNK